MSSSDSAVRDVDVAIVGAGIAGASLAFELSRHLRVALLEQEQQPGYHTTGRSAAVFTGIYGNEPIRALSRASRAFFDEPGPGFADHALLTPRGTLFVGNALQSASLQALFEEVQGRSPNVAWLSADEVHSRVPVFGPGSVAAGVFDPDAADIDAHSLHQGYLRGARRSGAVLVADSPVESIERSGQSWQLVSRSATWQASIVVNAAGAWAEPLGRIAGAAPVEVTPLRRTAIVFEDRAEHALDAWPMVVDIDHQFYFKPDAGRLLASPADETPSPPCDAQPDDYDIAVLIDRLETATSLRPKRITGRWAGLRSFAADRTPVLGFDAVASGFFWLAGQGGYGIQTAPAMAQLASSQILGHPMPSWLQDEGLDAHALSPRRFRQP